MRDDTVAVGDVIQVGALTVATISSASAASHHVFVAAGVGITAFLSLAERYGRINYGAAIHYAVRSAQDVPFRARLEGLGGGDVVVVLHDKTTGQQLDICRIIRDMPWNSHLYFCGPGRLMDEALPTALGIPRNEVHFGSFEPDVSGGSGGGDTFEVVVSREGRDTSTATNLKVGGEEPLLEVLQKQFANDTAWSCNAGNCGTCKVGLRQGRVDHGGTAISADEQATAMLPCCPVALCEPAGWMHHHRDLARCRIAIHGPGFSVALELCTTRDLEIGCQ